MTANIAMTVMCFITWLVGTLVIAPDASLELLLGMVMPLVIAVGTMTLVERTYVRDPKRLTPLMIQAFGAKMVLVGGYVAAVVGLTTLDPIPFIASFSLYFIGLHVTEAILLRSLFTTTVS